MTPFVEHPAISRQKAIPIRDREVAPVAWRRIEALEFRLRTQNAAGRQKHSGVEAAETEESIAQEECGERKGWDSQRNWNVRV